MSENKGKKQKNAAKISQKFGKKYFWGKILTMSSKINKKSTKCDKNNQKIVKKLNR